MLKMNRCFILVGAWILCGIQVFAVSPRVIRDSGTKLLEKGEFKAMALTSDGNLVPSHDIVRSRDSGREIVWDAIDEKKGNLICATGHQGQLVRLMDDKTSETVAKFDDPELTSLLRLDDGSLLVAGAPSGRIYRVDSRDEATTYTQLDASWVWRMVQDKMGHVWVASGSEGILYRLDGSQGDVRIEAFDEFQSANLLDIWIDSGGHMGEVGMIYIAGQNPGWLYRLDPGSGQIQVIYNSQLEEIRRIAVQPDGLALALNPERSPSNMTLKMTLRMNGSGVMTPDGSTPAISQPDPEKMKIMDKAFSTSGQEHHGGAKSEVVLLSREGFIRTLWAATQKPIHDMVRGPGQGLLISAGSEGRLFKVEADGRVAMIADLREDYIIGIRPYIDGYHLTCARNGLVYDMSGVLARKGVYTSRPIDGGVPVSWGHYYWHGHLGSGDRAAVAFRTSQHGDPESEYWTDWTHDQKVKNAEAVKLPDGSARFIQYRVILEQSGRGGDISGPKMEYAGLYYVEPNAAPRVDRVTVRQDRPKRTSVAAKKGKPKSSSELVKSGQMKSGKRDYGVRDLGLESARQKTARSNAMRFSVKWDANDPNSDKLIYRLYYRGDDETAWKIIDDEIQSAEFSLNTSVIADGRYRFRVVASDELSNPLGKALETEKVSDEYLVDNTPPEFKKVSTGVDGREVNLTVVLKDETSILSSLEVEIDNGDVYPVFPVDGILDQMEEKFEYDMTGLEPGEHVATFRATDLQGNMSVRKSVFHVDQ